MPDTVTFVSGGYSEWCIVVRPPRQLWGRRTEEHPTARLAAQELQDGLAQVCGTTLRRVAAVSSRAPRFELRYADGDGDGFTRTVENGSGGRVTLEGDSPRGLLFAVYDTLAELGCRWLYPGPDGIRIPQLRTLRLPVGAVRQEPSFAGRCLVIGLHFYLPDLEDWVVWAARNGINTVFLHPFPPPNLGGRPEPFWATRLQEALPLIQERGLAVEYGGHGLSELLPRSVFRSQPEAFRFDGTRRTRDHNFCPSHPETQRIVRENAAAFFQARPGVDVFHLWPDDIAGEGWCQCPLCADLTPADQALLAVNAIAEVLAEVNSTARIAFLAYHDTVAPPTRIQPYPNVCLVYAPRERCYAHPISDENCALNRDTYAPRCREQIVLFDEAGAPEHRVFEYYTDAFLFKSMLPPLPAVMAQDLRFYHDAGVHTVQSLMTSDRPWVTMPLNLWLFARLAWDVDADPVALVADWCAAAFGAADEAAAYVRAGEAAWQCLLTLAPDEASLNLNTSPRTLLADPPRDALDFMLAPWPTRRAKLQLLDEALPILEAAQTHLDAAAQTTTYPGALDRERAAFDLTRVQFAYLRARQRAYVLLDDADGTDTSPADLEAAIDEAQTYLEDALRWGRDRQHVPTRAARNLFSLTHKLWILHLRYVRTRTLEPGSWARRWLRVRTVLDLALGFLRLRLP